VRIYFYVRNKATQAHWHKLAHHAIRNSSFKSAILPMPEAPEQKARRQIDAMLAATGWDVQDYTRINMAASRGIALREILHALR